MRLRGMQSIRVSGIAAVAAALFLVPAVAGAASRYAVVPTQVIYPGDTLQRSQLDIVEVTNPNIAGGFAEQLSEVDGRVAKRTLLPGRTIPLAALREAFAIKRGASLRLTFAIGNMTISASGTSLSDAAVGELIKVRNTDSGVVVSGTVMADGTVQVMAK